ncbi:MAG: non-canonical purine NTP pyrophosphatase [Acidobacteria bacterium]|nr:non-canonical purine NTP pyrophosphatase [Acidobacteriota bacterium]
MTLYAATSNPGKLSEFIAAATSPGNSNVNILALPNLAAMPEPVEDAPTFMGNAELKACAYSLLAPGFLVFADDSGLETAALLGGPGNRSARFADDLNFEPEIASKDERNNRALLWKLQLHTDRSARFICAIALARSGQILLRSEGFVEGQILTAPKGADGFGYDPLFLIPSLGRTFAELPRQQKWDLSHRGKAFRSLLAQIRSTAL